MSGGAHLSPYLAAFKTDLFLSAKEEDVQEAINSNVAAAVICTHPEFMVDPNKEIQQIRIAFDGDAVLFTDESERDLSGAGLMHSWLMRSRMRRIRWQQDLFCEAASYAV